MARPQRAAILLLFSIQLPTLLLQRAECSSQRQLIDTLSRQQQALRSPKYESFAHHESVVDKKQQSLHYDNRDGQQVAKTSNRSTSVQDLRLTADFRAAKLRWIYERRQQPVAVAAEPASFDVRFCELTTWNAEIKCRHRELFANTSTDNSVIQTNNTTAAGQGLTILRRDDELIEYEAQVFDLRALTNYTFHVRVLRFSDEPKTDSREKDSSLANNKADRSTLARRLLVDGPAAAAANEIIGLVETKPFRAEATKCLADASEVSITTGKYFGGRITVEGNNLDKRCQLIGNKSSEQTSYTFKIDHELCRSKVINGTQIVTMVLVHENKDILTHNTARFLVICNFLQPSFTLRASISLPKVKGFSNNRPALITPLDGRPSTASKEKAVQLGSMPGVFRAKPPMAEASTTDSAQTPSSGISNELELQESGERTSTNSMKNESRQRQPKVLAGDQRHSTRPKSLDLQAAESSAHAQTKLPEPVQIQSNVLYVDRRQPLASVVSARIVSDGSSGKLVAESQTVKQNKTDEQEDLSSSVILTNNHRVVGDFRPTSSLKLAPSQQQAPSPSPQAASRLQSGDEHNDESLSIKYSGASKISDYSIGQLFADDTSQTGPRQQLSGSRHRGERTGRMQNISAPSAAPTDQLAGRDFSGASHTEVEHNARRMGDMIEAAAGADLQSDPSNTVSEINSNNQSSLVTNRTGQPSFQQHPNIAQNLTNYLLKWSLKTLGNLAKKSLESLANRSEPSEHLSDGAAAADNDSDVGEQPTASPEKQQTTSRTTIVTTTTTSRPSLLNIPSSTSDGFDTHSRPQQPQHQRVRQASSRFASTQTPSPVSANGAHPASSSSSKHATGQHQSRASNYSKSLDLDRVGGGQSHLGRAAQQPLSDHLARSNESGRQHMRHDSTSGQSEQQPGGNSMSWLLVGCLLSLALVMAILTIFCLASSHRSSPLFSSRSHPVPSCAALNVPQTPVSHKTVSSLPRLVFSSRPAANYASSGQSNETLNSRADILPTYSARTSYDYDRFENHARTSSSSSPSVTRDDQSSSASSVSIGAGDGDDESQSGLVLGNKRLSAGQPTAGSSSIHIRAGNRNTSRRQQIVVENHIDYDCDDNDADDENNCTNSELLLNQRALVAGTTTASSANESYA